MSVVPAASSPWLAEVDRELLRGRSALLLTGNVHDAYRWGGTFQNEHGALDIEAALGRLLAAAGYAVVAYWDAADGLRFQDPAMEERWAALGAAPAAPPPVAAVPAAAAPPGRQPPRAVAGSQRLLEISNGIRRALAQGEVPVAVVLHASVPFVADRERQPEPQDRCLLTHLLRAMAEAAHHAEGPAAGRRNALILIGSRAERIPEVLIHNNPHLALVSIPLPGPEERLAYLTAYYGNFHRSAPQESTPAPAVAEAFVLATDGMRIWDLEAIRRASLAERLPIERPRDLIAFFRCGQRDDPWERLDPAKLRSVRAHLSARVKGQDHAISAIEDMLIDARIGLRLEDAGMSGSGRPKGVFFFVGPTGVGKTDLAKALAEFIFGDEGALRRWDMSEFQQEHAAERLTGSPPGYVGHDSGGELTNWVRAHPFSILLFDEIEKAHPRVLDRFLQILEDGRLTDGLGRTVSFNRSVIIFTSNIGAATLDLAAVAAGALSAEQVQQHFRTAVRQHFVERLGRPELLNRIGSGIIAFDCLRPQHIDAICEKFLARLAAEALRLHGVRLSFPNGSVVAAIHERMLQGDHLANGGRRVRMLVEDLVKRPLTRWLFENGGNCELAIVMDAEGRAHIHRLDAAPQ
ncbi:MAG: AAA family ATPase [Burkholderiaceae bacterium]|nr:AAA family ATPase [Burkholderiaceae bacterium]